MKTTYNRQECDQKRAARGFASFKDWAKANKEAQGLHERKGNKSLVDALRREYAAFIQPYDHS